MVVWKARDGRVEAIRALRVVRRGAVGPRHPRRGLPAPATGRRGLHVPRRRRPRAEGPRRWSGCRGARLPVARSGTGTKTTRKPSHTTPADLTHHTRDPTPGARQSGSASRCEWGATAQQHREAGPRGCGRVSRPVVGAAGRWSWSASFLECPIGRVTQPGVHWRRHRSWSWSWS